MFAFGLSASYLYDEGLKQTFWHYKNFWLKYYTEKDGYQYIEMQTAYQ